MSRAELKLYGDIGVDVTIASVSSQLDALGDVDEIDVYITSNGGSVIQGVAIANLLEKHPAKIRTIVRGGAMSIAGFIACAGDERIIEEDSILHIHGPNYSVEGGNLATFEDAVEQLAKMGDAMARRYSKLTGKSEDEIRQEFDRDKFYSPAEAVELGYMSKVEASSGTLAAFIDTDKFKIPARLGAALARRAESTTPEIDTMSKSPATLKELKAKLPGASAEFLVSQQLSESTLEDATAAYVGELEAENKKLKAQAKAMESETVVVEEEEDEADEMMAMEEKLVEAVLARLTAMQEEEEPEAESGEEAEAMEDENGVDDEAIARIVNAAVAKAIGKTPAPKKQALARNRLGAQAIRKPTMTPKQAATETAEAQVKKLAQAKIAEGMSKPNAMRAVLKENPKLRDRLVAEAN